MRLVSVLAPVALVAVGIASCGGGGGGGNNSAPSKVSGLSPAGGAAGVATDVTLSWAAAAGAAQYFVYLGTASPLTDNDLLGAPTGTSLAAGALTPGTTYFWRVDAANPFGSAAGDEASFTTALGAPPKVTNPTPADGSTNQAPDVTLSWDAAPGATAYHIYFGTDPSPVDLRGSQAGTSLALETLAPGTTYYWRVDPENGAGTTTGDVYSFTTLIDVRVAESEPNDTSATADPLPLGRAGTGEVISASPGDVDFWAVELAAGIVYSIELRGIAGDQSNWSVTLNRPTLELRDTDGVSVFLDHLQALGTSMDQDMPGFTVPAAGTYFVVISRELPASTGGRYSVRVGSTSAGTVQQEAESATVHTTTGLNDDLMNAEPLQAGTLHGFHVDDELDSYRITVPQAAGILQFEVIAVRNGRSRGAASGYDPTLTLYDANGATLKSNDDAYTTDPGLEYAFDGTPVDPGDPPFELIIQVGEYQGSTADADYLLKYSFLNGDDAGFEQEPNDTAFQPTPIAYGEVMVGDLESPNTVDWFSFAGTAGDMVDIRPLDPRISDPGTGFTEDITVELFNLSAPALPLPISYAPVTNSGRPRIRTILNATTTYAIRVTAMPGAPDAGYGLVLENPLQADFEAEGFTESTNDNNFDAEPLPASGRVAGILGQPGDVDVFRFNASPGEVVEFALYCGSGDTNRVSSSDDDFGSSLTGGLEVQDINGVTFGATINGMLPSTGENLTTRRAACSVIFTAADPGIYTVRVVDADGGAGALYYYLLERQ